MPLKRGAFLLLLLVSGLQPAIALACPFCDGDPSGINPVKEAIFDEGFWFYLLAAALPFVLLLGVALVLLYTPVQPGTPHPLEGAVHERSS